MADERSHVMTAQGERMKWHYEYDASLRVSDIYEVAAGAADATPCMRTRYEYVGSTSRIDNALETTATWDSSWDIT